MQKLIIHRQFMGVKPCTIELNRFLLLIGEQASGKSTIAKLIYFFETLPIVIYYHTIRAYQRESKEDKTFLIRAMVGAKFIETFGTSVITREAGDNFEIAFYYGKEVIKIVEHSPNIGTSLSVDFDNDLLEKISQTVNGYFNAVRIDLKIDESKEREQFLTKLNSLFHNYNSDYTYLIAGRNIFSALPEVFERAIQQEYERLAEDVAKKQDFQNQLRLGNERMIYDFLQWSRDIRNFFKIHGQTFERVAQSLGNPESVKKIEAIAKSILKGEYVMGSEGEYIRTNEKANSIFLKDASSGQQEVLRILQGLFLSVGIKNRKEFFVVEEPEAHLYPLAQKELINAFALFLNTIKEGRLIITTHSPYILACVNILLFAQYVANQIGGQNGSINHIKREYWLDSSMFNAYSLGQNEAYCVNIKDAETGLIDQNYLDTISEQLGLQHQELYNLLTEKML